MLDDLPPFLTVEQAGKAPPARPLEDLRADRRVGAHRRQVRHPVRLVRQPEAHPPRRAGPLGRGAARPSAGRVTPGPIPPGHRTRAAALRRELGPSGLVRARVPGRAVRATASRPTASVRAVAADLGVAKNTAHRALAALVARRARRAESRTAAADGRFRPGRYRLHRRRGPPDASTPSTASRRTHRQPADRHRPRAAHAPHPGLTDAHSRPRRPTEPISTTDKCPRAAAGARRAARDDHPRQHRRRLGALLHPLPGRRRPGRRGPVARPPGRRPRPRRRRCRPRTSKRCCRATTPSRGRGSARPLVDRFDAKGRLIPAVAGFDATFSAPEVAVGLVGAHRRPRPARSPRPRRPGRPRPPRAVRRHHPGAGQRRPPAPRRRRPVDGGVPAGDLPGGRPAAAHPRRHLHQGPERPTGGGWPSTPATSSATSAPSAASTSRCCAPS